MDGCFGFLFGAQFRYGAFKGFFAGEVPHNISAKSARIFDCTVLGTQYSFGIFFVEIVDEFNSNEGSAAWVPALAMVCDLLLLRRPRKRKLPLLSDGLGQALHLAAVDPANHNEIVAEHSTRQFFKFIAYRHS